MPLIRYGAGLLRRGDALAASVACCCGPGGCTDLPCPRYCVETGTTTDPEGECPPGWNTRTGWDGGCRKVTPLMFIGEGATCEDCTSQTAPEGLADYQVSCIGYCCTNEFTDFCLPDPCCTCSESCAHPAGAPDGVIIDNSGLNANGEGFSRTGQVSGEPSDRNWTNGSYGVEWARYYPDQIGQCYFWWYSVNACLTVIDAGSATTPRISLGILRERFRLYGCVDGVWQDITATAVTNGPLERFFTFGTPTGAESAFGGVPCPTDPDDDFLDPIIDCNPLP